MRNREQLPVHLRTKSLDYARVVAEINAVRRLIPWPLTLYAETREVRIGEQKPFKLEHIHFALYRLMAEWARDQVPGAGPDGVGDKHRGLLTGRHFTNPEEYQPNPVERFIQLYERALRTGEERLKNLQLKITAKPSNNKQRQDNSNYFNPQFSQLRALLSENFDNPILADRYGARVRKKVGTQIALYGLLLLPDEIKIEDPDESGVALPG